MVQKGKPYSIQGTFKYIIPHWFILGLISLVYLMNDLFSYYKPK